MDEKMTPTGDDNTEADEARQEVSEATAPAGEGAEAIAGADATVEAKGETGEEAEPSNEAPPEKPAEAPGEVEASPEASLEESKEGLEDQPAEAPDNAADNAADKASEESSAQEEAPPVGDADGQTPPDKVDTPDKPENVEKIDIVGIRFPNSGKTYCFGAGKLGLRRSERVVVESELGISIGQVVKVSCDVPPPGKLKNVLRKVTEADRRQEDENEEVKREAREYAMERIKTRELAMKLLYTDVTLDRKRFIFYFTADTRIDFRELVKDLASKFRTRIELRQIGVRDAARMIGGFGLCGQELCCKTWLKSFAPISIKMAKQQDLVLNTCKLSGLCGRLMCCLNYEYDPNAPKRKRPEPKKKDQAVSEEALEKAVGAHADKSPAGRDKPAGRGERPTRDRPAARGDAPREAREPREPREAREARQGEPATGPDAQARDDAGADRKKKRRRRGGRKRNKPSGQAGQAGQAGDAASKGEGSGASSGPAEAGKGAPSGDKKRRRRRRRRKPGAGKPEGQSGAAGPKKESE